MLLQGFAMTIQNPYFITNIILNYYASHFFDGWIISDGLVFDSLDQFCTECQQNTFICFYCNQIVYQCGMIL